MKLPGSVLVNEGKRGKGKGPCNLVREKCKQRISTMWLVCVMLETEGHGRNKRGNTSLHLGGQGSHHTAEDLKAESQKGQKQVVQAGGVLHSGQRRARPV